MTPDSLPFEYPFRWRNEDLAAGAGVSPETAALLEQRDRDLEDYLAGIGGVALEVDHGSSTIADTTSTKVVSHGLGSVPVSIQVTAHEAEALGVTARDWTHFTVVRAGTTGDMSFDWLAIGVEEPLTGGAYENAVLADAPLLFLPLDDLALPTAVASVGDDATYAGQVSLREAGPGPGLPYAAALAGTGNQYVGHPSHFAALDVGTGEFAFEIWMKSTKISGGAVIFGRDHNSTGNGQLCALAGAGTSTLYTGGSATGSGGVIALHDSTWHHVVYQRAGSNHEFWVDGARVVNASAPNNTNISGILRLGVANGIDIPHFQGYMAGFAYYNRALTSLEIDSHIAAV